MRKELPGDPSADAFFGCPKELRGAGDVEHFAVESTAARRLALLFLRWWRGHSSGSVPAPCASRLARAFAKAVTSSRAKSLMPPQVLEDRSAPVSAKRRTDSSETDNRSATYLTV